MCQGRMEFESRRIILEDDGPEEDEEDVRSIR
jgi:hypothetical protein